MPPTRRQVTIGSSAVTIDTTERPDGSLFITALTDSGERYEHVVVLGAVDRPLPTEFTAVQAQSDLDAAHDFAARMAESAARRKALVAGLK